jgi:hypothetical protein
VRVARGVNPYTGVTTAAKPAPTGTGPAKAK